MIRFTYRDLLELVEGDAELIVHLVEEELVERHEDIVTIDLDRVLLARTLWRDLEVDWPAIGIILKLATELAESRQRIAELEAALAAKR